jgi:hypothetical protein
MKIPSCPGWSHRTAIPDLQAGKGKQQSQDLGFHRNDEWNWVHCISKIRKTAIKL